MVEENNNLYEKIEVMDEEIRNYHAKIEQLSEELDSRETHIHNLDAQIKELTKAVTQHKKDNLALTQTNKQQTESMSN